MVTRGKWKKNKKYKNTIYYFVFKNLKIRKKI
jgi:hypothetical protein